MIKGQIIHLLRSSRRGQGQTSYNSTSLPPDKNFNQTKKTKKLSSVRGKTKGRVTDSGF